MAKKTKRTDSFNLDDDLDFGEYDFGDIDSQLSPEVKDKKSRSPATEVFKGTISGAKNRLKDPAFAGKIIKDSLPPNYEYVAGEAGKALDTMSNLYNEASREIKPQLQRLAGRVDKLVPADSRLLKKMTAKFKNIVGEPYESSTGDPNLQEQAIVTGIAQVFGAQAASEQEAKARDAAEGKIKDQIETKRFKTNFGLLSGMNDSLTRMVSYQDKITLSYQKKSLELQYRSYFVQKELLDTTARSFKMFEKYYESINKNTALPEFVKIKGSEAFKEQARKSLFGNIQGQISKKISAAFKQQLAGFQAGMANAESIIDAVEQFNEMSDSMGEMGMEDTSKTFMLSEIIGAQAMDWFSKKISNPLKEAINKNKKAKAFGDNAGSKLMGASAELKRHIKDNDLVRKSNGTGLEALLAKAILVSSDMLTPEKSRIVKDATDLGALNDPYYVTRKAVTSLTDVIPGFLSKIHYEVSAQRLGADKAKLLTFDYQSGKFRESKELTGLIMQTVNKKIASAGALGYTTDNGYKFLTGGVQHNTDIEKELKIFMMDMSQEDIVYDKRGIKESKSYGNLSKESKKVVDENLRDMFSDDKAAESKLNMTSRLKKIKTSLPDISTDIKTMIDAGFGDRLESEGLITINEDGSHVINMEKYRQLMIDNNIVASDENIKRNISKYNPKNALAAIKKTKVYSWFYKNKMGPEGQKTGPMAQDVKENFGEDVAPGGKGLDLLSMNGANMAAIQHLSEKQDKQVNNTSANKILSAIKKDSSAIVKILKSKNLGSGQGGGRGKSTGYKDDITNMASSGFDFITRLGSDGASAFGKVVKNSKDKVINPAYKGLQKAFDASKEPVGKAIAWLSEKAINVSGTILNRTQDLITNQIPKGLQFAKGKFDQVKDYLSNLISGPLNVYVKGISEPLIKHTLMRAGYYMDSATGKVIKTVEDIKSIKGDIVDKTGKVVMTIEQMADGIFDDKGKEIKTAASKIGRAAMAIGLGLYRRAKKNFKKFAETARGLGDKLKGKFKGLGLGDKLGSAKDSISSMFSEMQLGFSTKSYEVLVEIRDILKGKSGSDTIGKKGFRKAVTPGSSDSKDSDSNEPGALDKAKGLFTRGKDLVKSKIPGWKDKATGAATTWKDKAASAMDRAKGMFGKGDEFVGPIHPGISEDQFIGPKRPGMKDKAKGLFSRGKAGVLSGITSLKNKDYKGMFNNVANKFKGSSTGEQGEQTKPEQPQGESGERKGNWKDRLKNLANKAKTKFIGPDLTLKYNGGDGMGGLMDKVKGLFDTMSGGLGKMFGKGGLLGKAGELFGKFGSKAGKLATATNVATKGSKLATVGRAAMTVGRVGLALGSVGLGTLGTVGGAIGGALLSVLTGPVVLAAGAAVAVGFGAYKLYKYLKGNPNEIDKLRIYQYGLTQEPAHQSYYRQIIALESYIEKEALGFKPNKEPFINAKNLDMKEVYAVFSIDDKDDEATASFNKWFNNRFKPFFLTNISALYAANPKCGLQDIKGLTIDEKIKYLSLMSFESGPYDETSSPFKAIPYLSSDKNIAINAIKNMTDTLSKQKLADTKSKQGDNRNKKPEPPKTKSTIAPPKPDTGLNTGKKEEPAGKSGEGDGAPNNTTAATSSSQGDKVGKIDKLKIASGELKDGSGADAFIKLGAGVNIANMNPEMVSKLRGMVQEYGEATGKSVLINDGHRSRADQERIYRAKNGKGVAKPGSSLHEFGLAVDINQSILDEMEELGLMRKYGFTRPVGQEPWHMEPAGIQGNIQQVKANRELALKLVASSPGTGGGGYGTMKEATKWKRNDEVAIQTASAGASTVSGGSNPNIKLAVDNTKKSIIASNPMSKNNNLPTQSANNGSYGSSISATNAPISGGGTSMASSGSSDVDSAIKNAAAETGADGGMMKAFAQIESGMNPNAKATTSSASGLYGFTNATWKEQLGKHGQKYGLSADASPNDPHASSLMAGELLKQNIKGLKKVKDNPDIVDVYLSHFLGLGGAKKFLSADPSATGESILPDAAKANKAIFYDKGRPRTISEIRSLIAAKVTKAAGANGIDISQQAVSKAQPGISAAPVTSTTPTEQTPAEYNKTQPQEKPRSKLVSVPTSFQGTATVSNDKGQNLGQDNLTAGLNTVNDTMVKSLDVQTQMLEVLRGILDNVNPENLNAFKESLSSKQAQSNNTGNPVVNQPRPLPSTGIDLRRRSA